MKRFFIPVLCFALLLSSGLYLGSRISAQQGGAYSNPISGNISVADAGTCSTTNSFVWQHLPSTAGITTLNLAGTFTATITVRESNNGGATWATITTLTTTGTTTYGTNGFTDFCADVTAFTSGPVVISVSTGTQAAVVGAGSALGGANSQLLFNSNGAIGGAAGLTTSGTVNGSVLTVTDSGAQTMISANGTTGVLVLGRSGTGGITIAGTTGAITLGTASRLLLKDQGQCTMAAGTCTAQSFASTYTAAPLTFITWTGTGTCTGILKSTSTTTTVTPSSSVGTDTCQVNWSALGN